MLANTRRLIAHTAAVAVRFVRASIRASSHPRVVTVRLRLRRSILRTKDALVFAGGEFTPGGWDRGGSELTCQGVRPSDPPRPAGQGKYTAYT